MTGVCFALSGYHAIGTTRNSGGDSVECVDSARARRLALARARGLVYVAGRLSAVPAHATRRSRCKMPDDDTLELTIVIPAFDEEDRIGPTLQRVLGWLDARARQGCDEAAEVLVVDDGSTDQTRARVEAIAAEDRRVRLVGGLPNRGKGHAVGLGIEHARGQHVLFTDADLSMPIEGYDRLREALEREGADIAIASRAIAGATVGERPPLHRKAMGRVFNAVVRMTVLPGVHDTQCGFKLFTREAARAVFPHRALDGFAFDVEILYVARKLGFRITEVPTHWSHNRASRILPLRDSVKMFWSVVQIPVLHRKL